MNQYNIIYTTLTLIVGISIAYAWVMITYTKLGG